MPLPVVLRQMLSLPTAPFAETAVLEYVRRVCEPLPGVSLREDRWGNLLALYRHRPPRRTPLVFSAHTDHPGFVAQTMRGEDRLRAAFRGWVEAPYFENARVRFWSNGRWIRGVVQKITKMAKAYRMIGRSARPEQVELRVDGPVEPNAPGMWDLPDPFERGGLVHARGCDDIAGCAAMVALLQRLARRRARAEVHCLFTRAEEVGFIGAIGAARSGTVSRSLPVVAIETSKALPNARQGDGAVLRVGDKTSVFSPGLTDYCNKVAMRLARRRKSFRYQRKLMDGGTCESTAFCAYGYMATGVCVPLGNYHNMNTQTQRIDCETVHLDDWKGMVDWFEALVLDDEGFSARSPRAHSGLEDRFAQWRRLLEDGAARPRRSAPAQHRRTRRRGP